MTPEEKEEIRILKEQVAELLAWKREREVQQFSFPLDPTSIKILNETMRSERFSKINVRSVYLFTSESTDPSVDGQIVYHDSSDTLKVRLNGTVKTITTS